MSWRPNSKLGYAMWASAKCCVCDAVAHYSVGTRGFCKRHRELANKARAAASYRLDIENAIGQRHFDEKDGRTRRSETNHSARGRKNKGKA